MRLGLLLTIVMIVMSLFSGSVARTIDLSPDANLLEVIDISSPNDTILVSNGVYQGKLNISKPLHLIAKGPRSAFSEGRCIIDANREDAGIIITSSGVTLEGFVILNSSGPGLLIDGGDNIITGCEVRNCRYGIVIYSNNNNISKNKISDNSDGIILRNCIGNLILDNLIEGNNHWDSDCGLVLYFADNNIIMNNNLSDNGVSAISLRGSTNNSLKNNTIMNSRWYGIYLYQQSNDNRVLNNNASKNLQANIAVEDSRRNSIVNNEISKGERGILLTSDSYQNNVEDNRIRECGRGIHVSFRSKENSIWRNLISGNEFGIQLSFSASRNIISENILFDNEFNAYDESSSNFWDDGSIGNYYDDFGSNYNVLGGAARDFHPMKTIP